MENHHPLVSKVLPNQPQLLRLWRGGLWFPQVHLVRGLKAFSLGLHGLLKITRKQDFPHQRERVDTLVVPRGRETKNAS